MDPARTRNNGREKRIITRGAKTGPKLYNGIERRRDATILAQLRTGHCPLNKYLHRVGRRESPECGCGYGEETVEHFLLECPRYSIQRRALRGKVGVMEMNMATLLGRYGVFKHTMEFIRDTKRMDELKA